jgi:hypothetical protein
MDCESVQFVKILGYSITVVLSSEFTNNKKFQFFNQYTKE